MASETFTGADSRADAFVCPLSAELARFVNPRSAVFSEDFGQFRFSITGLSGKVEVMASHDVHSRLAEYLQRQPSIAETAFVAPTASLMGAVTVGEHASIWYQVVVRADIHSIQIGSRTNIQDGSILHVADQFPLFIGNEVTCGHRAILHACSIGDRVLVGMGAIILDGVEIGEDCIIGAQALVTKGSKIPPGSLVIGSPAKVHRPLTNLEISSIASLADKYVNVAAYHRDRLNRQRAQTSGDQKAE